MNVANSITLSRLLVTFGVFVCLELVWDTDNSDPLLAWLAFALFPVMAPFASLQVLLPRLALAPLRSLPGAPNFLDGDIGGGSVGRLQCWASVAVRHGVLLVWKLAPLDPEAKRSQDRGKVLTGAADHGHQLRDDAKAAVAGGAGGGIALAVGRAPSDALAHEVGEPLEHVDANGP